MARCRSSERSNPETLVGRSPKSFGTGQMHWHHASWRCSTRSARKNWLCFYYWKRDLPVDRRISQAERLVLPFEVCDALRYSSINWKISFPIVTRKRRSRVIFQRSARWFAARRFILSRLCEANFTVPTSTFPSRSLLRIRADDWISSLQRETKSAESSGPRHRPPELNTSGKPRPGRAWMTHWSTPLSARRIRFHC